MENPTYEMDMETPDPNSDVTARHQSRLSKICGHLRENLVMTLTLCGIGLGFVLGLAIREANPSDDAILWIGMPGTLYMRLLKLTIVPLVACSVISGCSRLDPTTSGKIGAYCIAFIIITHVIACGLATGLVLLIKPGAKSHDSSIRKLDKAMKTHDVFADLLRNLMPDNIVSTTFRQSLTKYVQESEEKEVDSNQNFVNKSTGSNRSIELTAMAKKYTRVVSHSDGINVLGLITICAFFGVAAGKVRSTVPYFLHFMDNSLMLVLIVIRWFYCLTPIGVVSLIATAIAKVDNVFGTFSDLGLFVLSVTLAILLHWVVILPSLYAFFVRKNPLPYFLAQFSAVSIAFAGTNSSVAMPEMFNVCENKFHMDKRFTRVSIPLTITMNADGSSIFIVSACIFVADYTGIGVTAENVMVILILGIVSSMAIPGTPSASIFTIIIILTALRIPLENVAILFAVEWFLDRLRTGLNLASHLTIVAVVHSWCRELLKRLDKTENTDHAVTETKELLGGNVAL